MKGGEQRQDILTRLGAVNWPVVLTPATAASHGPALVTDLWRPEAAEAAVRTLRRVCAQGEYLYPAAVELLPFLTLAAADPSVPVRAPLIDAVGEIAATAARAQALGHEMRLPAMASLRTGPGPSPASQIRSLPAATWPTVWDRAVTDLCALLDDPSPPVRRSTAAALAQATARAEEVTRLLQSRCDIESDAVAAERMVASIAELTLHTSGPHRQDLLTWLRAHLPRGHVGRPDLRLPALRALRRVLPTHDDPIYARTAAEVLLDPTRHPSPARSAPSSPDPGHHPSAARPDLFDLQASEVREVGELLGGDLDGRLALTRGLLRHPRPEHRTGGLELAAALLADRRSVVPALLPEVAGLVDDPLPANRALALRILAMCTTASRPWADAVAAHTTPDDEPDPLVRTQALWALGKMGDRRCVPVLAARMSAGPRRERRDGFRDWLPLSNVGRWSDLELNFCELLTPLAVHHRDLLTPLLAKMAARHDRLHYPQVLAAWHHAGAPVVPDLVELLDTEYAIWAAYALTVIAPGPVAVGREHRLRPLLGPLDPRGRNRERLDPLLYWRLTGDTGPVLTALDAGPTPAWYRAEIYAELGPAAAGGAEWLRQELRTLRPALALRHLRALWRVTGDPAEVVPALLSLTAPASVASDTVPALLTLCEIAPTGQVLDRLRALIHRARSLGHERTLGVARALWQHSRRADEVVPALMTLVDQVTEPSGWRPPTRLEPLALLAEIAAADPEGVAPALPRLRALVDTDERPYTYRNWRPVERRHWRSVEDDEALRAAAHAVLTAAAR
ncbi:HEAT repeat domain-containing protein [Nonomuraea sp. NPDC050328]|uniref:HEAT repeat domain-containing protein n=1 Tax=Nonomuraea sp. NPDC050328 TaxID=3364361 RepID=UPI0037971251